MQYVQYDWGITKIPGPPKPVTLCFLSFKKLILSDLSAYLHLSCRSEILKHHQRWYIWEPWPTNTIVFYLCPAQPQGLFPFPRTAGEMKGAECVRFYVTWLPFDTDLFSILGAGRWILQPQAKMETCLYSEIWGIWFSLMTKNSPSTFRYFLFPLDWGLSAWVIIDQHPKIHPGCFIMQGCLSELVY